MKTAVDAHALDVGPLQAQADVPLARMPPLPRVRLAQFEQQAIDGLVEGDATELHAWLRDRATALSGPDRDQVRLRMLSRAVATASAKATLLETLMDERLRAGDERGALLVNRLLDSAVKRLDILVERHRLWDPSRSRTQVVAVQNAGKVIVQAGEE